MQKEFFDEKPVVFFFPGKSEKNDDENSLEQVSIDAKTLDNVFIGSNFRKKNILRSWKTTGILSF